MKNRLVVLSLLGSIAASPGASAQGTLGEPRAPQRGEWGCEVLLCLANPDGPTAVEECEPPIERLRRHLERGRSFPSCNMATGPNGRSYAAPGRSHYDDCPAGTTALEAGQIAVLANPMPTGTIAPSYASGAASTYTAASTAYAYTGIGDGSSQAFGAGEDSTMAAKICVSGLRGTRTVGAFDNSYEVSVYDTIYVQHAQTSARYIDVYIDDAVWHRVRW